MVIGKRKRSVRERSIECELEKISLNSSPDETDPLKMNSIDAMSVITDERHQIGAQDSMDLDMKQMYLNISNLPLNYLQNDFS